MAVENAIGVNGTTHKPPNNISRLMRNIIMGSEFIMSHITHFYALAAISYVQGPPIAPWTPYFADSYYVPSLQQGNALGGNGRAVPDPTKLNINAFSLSYTGIDGIWDNVVIEYVMALKHRREVHHMCSLLGGRTPQIQNGCVVGGSASQPTSADISKVKSTVQGVESFLTTRMIPLTHIVSYLYGPYGGSVTVSGGRNYDNDGTNPRSGFGSGAAGAGASRVLAWGAFDKDMNGGDDPLRLLRRGCYEWDGAAMNSVNTPSTLWSNLKEYITNSRYDNDTTKGDATRADSYTARHPSSGYTKANAATGYSWAKSPRIMAGATAKACQVGPLARMAVNGEREGAGANYWDAYKIGTTKAQLITTHEGLAPILTAGSNLATVQSLYGTVPANFRCGFSTMDRHRARALEALKIAKAITTDDGTGQGWCDQLTAALGGSHYTSWTMPGPTSGTKTGYGAHEAPRGALAHFVEITNGKISNYQAVVPTTWNVNPEAPTNTPGPIESAIIGINVSGVASGGHKVPVEALRVVQGFDPCIACTVH